MQSAPRRIVSLVPSTTESVCAFGGADRLVACTRYCCEPAAELAAVPRIGGTKNPDLARIAALQPDLVLVNGEENRAEDVAWLAERFPVLQQTPGSVREARQALQELALAMGALDAAEPFLLRIDALVVAAEVAQVGQRPVRVFYAVWQKPWMSINRTTFVHDVLRLAGADNVCANEPARYPEVTPAQIDSRGPAVVLLPDEPWEFSVEAVEDLAREGCFGRARLVRCRGRDFCWHGTHLAEGLEQAMVLLASLRRELRGGAS